MSKFLCLKRTKNFADTDERMWRKQSKHHFHCKADNNWRLDKPVFMVDFMPNYNQVTEKTIKQINKKDYSAFTYLTSNTIVQDFRKWEECSTDIKNYFTFTGQITVNKLVWICLLSITQETLYTALNKATDRLNS